MRVAPVRSLSLAVGSLLALSLVPSGASAQDPSADEASNARIEALERKVKRLEEALERAVGRPAAPAAGDDVLKRLDEVDQQVRILGRHQELDRETAAARSKETPSVFAGKDGFGFLSADGQFRLRFGALVQADLRGYLTNDFPGGAPDNFVLRRVRPLIEGNFFGKYGFRIQPEFGNQGSQSLLDAYVDANLTPSFRIRAGKFKVPVGLERLQSPSDMSFVEFGFPTQLLPNRDIGIQFAGDLFGGRLSYGAGFFDGVRDGASTDSDNNSAKDFNGRLFAYPFKLSDSETLRGFGIGVAVTTGMQAGTAASGNLSSYVSPGQQTFFSYSTGTFAAGNRQRWTPQFTYYSGPLGILGEYARVNQAVTRSTHHRDVTHHAWQVYATWVLTGEDASYTRVTPRQPFNPEKGTWGAFEIGARISGLSVDEDVFIGSSTTRLADPASSARKATDVGFVLNWYLNRTLKLQFNYDRTRFEGGGAGGRDLPTERILFSRFQAAF